jgi:glucose/arabinose dehydrogenase
MTPVVRILAALTCTTAIAALGISKVQATAPAERGPVELKRLGGFTEPVLATGAPGERDLVFVAELEGAIRVIDGRRVLPRPFLDISDDVSTVGLSGLLGLAFDPDYERNRLFYVYYTNDQGNPQVDSFRRKRGSDVRAAAGSRRKVIELGELDGTGHIGGSLVFDRKGLLYLAIGDGGGEGGDLDDDAQSKGSLAGKLLRIRPLARGRRDYGVPRSNPYVGRRGQDEIYALGLRNPFRFSIDRRRIFIGDVGEAGFEEINITTLRRARGANFGWDRFEGENLFDPSAPLTGGEHTKPFFAYGTGSAGCSVTGGLVIRDRRLGDLVGRYLYADYCAGSLRTIDPGGPADDRGLGVSVEGPVGFGVDGRGRIMVAAFGEGAVYRLRPR